MLPDIIWNGLPVIGGFLLLNTKWARLAPNEKRGVVIIFATFIAHVYWDILHETTTSKFIWDSTSIINTIFVTIIVVVGLAIGIYTEHKTGNKE